MQPVVYGAGQQEMQPPYGAATVVQMQPPQAYGAATAYPTPEYGAAPAGPARVVDTTEAAANPHLESLKNNFRPRGGIKKSSNDESAGCFSQALDYMISVVMMGVNIFKALLASLLFIFVPQYCSFNQAICTVGDAFHSHSNFGYFALVLNFFTLAFLLCSHSSEFARELQLIDDFDEDLSLPDNNLPDVIDAYPEMKARLYSSNLRCFIIALISSVLLLANGTISAIYIFTNRWSTYTTATSLLANVLLVLYKFYESTTFCWAGMKHGLAFSLYQTEPVSFNTIDKRKVNKKS
eukprot:gnl/Spiro4/23543_TR11633_c0_g1_i1.p1 gnl/Spiro4/23543_TR11633_c0_g1~~gnl/Spiro4/23543_TR11633_c0_g1_i1.p1  ORF type:complete len:311 (+),score=80.12 gnl/Spiro4/23543_TR11633_c0_g1_i1:53-934(+)